MLKTAAISPLFDILIVMELKGQRPTSIMNGREIEPRMFPYKEYIWARMFMERHQSPMHTSLPPLRAPDNIQGKGKS